MAVAQVINDGEFEKPYYYLVDESRRGFKNKTSEDLYKLNSKPTLQDLVRTCTKERNKYVDPTTGESRTLPSLFEQGMWVEYRSADMKWKLASINRVVRQPPDDWDYDEEESDPPEDIMLYSYNIGSEGLVPKEYVRAPEEGLQFIFGMRPWLWQQFTLLQLEKRTRFDKNNEDDFEEIDNQRFAIARYEAWLNSPENADFKKHHDAQPEIAQDLLRNHLLTPFNLMDYITERKDEWNFRDHDISVYTYLGVLGSGVSMAVVTVLIQILTPMLLLYNNLVQSDGEPTTRFFVDENSNPENGKFFPATNLETFCSQEGRLEGRILITCVLLIYLSSVVPDNALQFFRVSGGARTTYSRIHSLRTIIWEQNSDDILQQIGFKMDRYMNTGYICILYSIQLFILFNTQNVLDIILNALAIEYIHQIDESLTDADWWDEEGRWIRAGTVELVMQSVLRLRVLESGNRICQEYDIDPKEYKAALGSTSKSLCNRKVAHKDDNDIRHMTKREESFFLAAQDAEEKGNLIALDDFRKKVIQFGYNGKIAVFFGLRSKGMFHRYTEYRVWSRWEKVLFLPRIPSDKSEFKMDTLARKIPINQNDYWEFAVHVMNVLMGIEAYRSIHESWRHGYYAELPLRIVLAILEIFFYLVEIAFPIFAVFGLFIIPLCY